MKVDIVNFWGENFYNHPKFEDELHLGLQSRLGVELPTLYIDLLRQQNGGFTKGFVFPTKVKTTWSPTHVPLDNLCGIVLDKSINSPHNLMNTEYFISEDWGLPMDTVAISGDGHWWIVLDYRNNFREPKISWVDAEVEQDIIIADSFDEFFNGLIQAKDLQEVK